MGNSPCQYPVGQLRGAAELDAVARKSLQGSQTPGQLVRLEKQPMDDYLGELMPTLLSLTVKLEVIAIEVKLVVVEHDTPGLEPSYGLSVDDTLVSSSDMAGSIQQPAEHSTPVKRQKLDSWDNAFSAIVFIGNVLMYNYSQVESLKCLLNPHKVSSTIKKALVNGVTELDQESLTLVRNLKRALIEYNTWLERIIQYYTTGVVVRPAIKDLEGGRKTIEKLSQQLTCKKLDKLIRRPDLGPEHVLCAVLGVRPECAEWMRSMPDDVRHHQSDEYWIHQFLENQRVREELSDASIGDAYDNIETADLAEKYEALGFTDSRAHELVQRLSCIEHRDHQNLIYWANKHIENSFATDILLTDSPRYPYGCDKLDCRQEEPIPADYRTGDDELEGTWPVRYYNVDKLIAQQEESKRTDTDGEYEYWYHGTQHYCAQHIIENGIDVEKGCEKQDFSDGKGFYVFPEFSAAESWAKATGDRGAVVVFKVPKRLLVGFSAWDLGKDPERYGRIVKYCRSGKRTGIFDRKEAREFENIHFVTGPMPLNTGDQGRASQQQLCIKTWHCADAFGDVRNIDAVYFF